MQRKRIITISRQLKVNNKLKNYLEDNMWYRRKIYNKFVEWYKEWDETRGHVNEHLKLGKKYLKCSSCGTRIDRDVNASYNCFKYGLKEIIA